MSFEADRKQPEPVGALQPRVRPLPVHHWGWYRTMLFSLSSFPSLESCGCPSCPSSDPGSAALCCPGFGDGRLKFSGCPEKRCQKNLQTLISYSKGTPCSHLPFPCFHGSHRVCSLFAGRCALLLFRGCTAAPSLAEMLLLLGSSRAAWSSKECCRAV